VFLFVGEFSPGCDRGKKKAPNSKLDNTCSHNYGCDGCFFVLFGRVNFGT
jgi:hypothetical protein